jgi:hypothetical protein
MDPDSLSYEPITFHSSKTTAGNYTSGPGGSKKALFGGNVRLPGPGVVPCPKAPACEKWHLCYYTGSLHGFGLEQLNRKWPTAVFRSWR